MSFVSIIDLTGEEEGSRLETISGSQESSSRIGRAIDLSGNGIDVTALDSAGRPKAGAGFALYDEYNEHRLASDAFGPTGPETYIAIRFRQDNSLGSGCALIVRGDDNSGKNLCYAAGDGNFYLIEQYGTNIPSITNSSGDHTLEIWAGTPARFSIDLGPITDCDDDWTDGLKRLVIGGRNIGLSNRSWLGRIYRVVLRDSPPADEWRRAQIQDWLEGIGPIPGTVDPPTEEEAFHAAFEDVSGRDPLPTALLERTPARQLAGHNVKAYLYPPYQVTKRLPVRLDQYYLTKPGRVMWHKDDIDPLFFMGRWAQIEGRTFTDNPLEVELDLRISNHPESFEP